MKRYLINGKLKKAIKNSNMSTREMSRLLNFEVKNLTNKNKTIREDHLRKITSLLNLKLSPKEAEMNYEKNLGRYSISASPKKVRKTMNLAEFIGIMLGDGNIWENQVRISFDKRNQDYINHVKNLARNLFGIELRLKYEKSSNGATLYYYNKRFIEQLIEFGLQRGDKIKNKTRVPEWIKGNKNYTKRCIGGLIDTDGCIYMSKRERKIYIKFTNFNKQLLKDFKEMTNSLKYSFASANKNNWCLYRENEVVNFIKEIQPFKSKGAMGQPG